VMNNSCRGRLVVASIHFLLTLLVGGIAATLIFLVWFPGSLARMVGGTQLFWLVFYSDLALGPLISLVIFNKKKTRKELVVDYSLVGVVQLGALTYGISIIAVSRPVFVAFIVDRFEVVTAVELNDSDLAEAIDMRYRSRPWLGPKLVGVQMPANLNEHSDLIFSAVAGKDAQFMPKYYRPYEASTDEVRRKSGSIEALVSRHQEKRQELDLAIKELGHTSGKLRWLPVHHRFGFWTALIDAKTGYPVKYLPIDPY